MWQTVNDVSNRKVMANFFTDQWPKFTTIVSQEFTPRISEVLIANVLSFDFFFNFCSYCVVVCEP